MSTLSPMRSFTFVKAQHFEFFPSNGLPGNNLCKMPLSTRLNAVILV
jgi:hypothetical protein